MPASSQSNEIDRLSRRFEIAVANFGQSCIAMRANEKAFQAWFAAGVIQEFGLSRVYREIHLAKKDINELTSEFDVPQELHKELRVGNELFPDISVSWQPDIDARHSKTREHNVRHAGALLRKFAIITELKVTGSGINSTDTRDIKLDLWKLALFASTHQKYEPTGAHTDEHHLVVRTYMVIMDNFSKNGAFKSAYSSGKLNGIFDSVSSSWPQHVDKPTILVLSSIGVGAKMSVYRGFHEEA